MITKEISGFLCQPRFDKGEAGDVLENIAELLRSYEQAAVLRIRANTGQAEPPLE